MINEGRFNAELIETYTTVKERLNGNLVMYGIREKEPNEHN